MKTSLLPLSLCATLSLAGAGFAQQADAPAAKSADAPGDAELSINLGEAEARANSAEVDALLKKVMAAHDGILQYRYQASAGVTVMMGGPGAGEEMDAEFGRSGVVTQGGPLGTKITVDKGLELPGMGAVMSEKMTILLRSDDLLIDYAASEMAAMTGGPQGLTRISKEDLAELAKFAPMPAPMNFVMLHTPAHADPRALVEQIARHTALTEVSGDELEIVLSGLAAPSFLPALGPQQTDAKEVPVRITIDRADARLLQVELGPKDKPRVKLSFSEYAVPEKLSAADFDLNPDGKDIADLAPLLRSQLEGMISVGGHPGGADDEDEF